MDIGTWQFFVLTPLQTYVMENQDPVIEPLYYWRKDDQSREPPIEISSYEKIEVFHPCSDDQLLAETIVRVDDGAPEVIPNWTMEDYTPDHHYYIFIGSMFRPGWHRYSIKVADIYGRESEEIIQEFYVSGLCSAGPSGEKKLWFLLLLPFLSAMVFTAGYRILTAKK